MQKRVIRCLMLISSGLMLWTAPAPAWAFDEAAVRADCDEEWEDDFTMVAYCREQESSAGVEVDGLVASHAAATAEGKIIRSCLDEWGTQYTMVAYCWEQESGANQWLASFAPDGVPQDIVDRIQSRCEAEWSTQYTMVQYCINQQIDAWRSLQ